MFDAKVQIIFHFSLFLFHFFRIFASKRVNGN